MSSTLKRDFVDYLFWFTFILFTNPGGVLEAITGSDSSSGINVTDLLFVVLLACFMVVVRIDTFLEDHRFVNLLRCLFVFALFYVIIFAFFVPVLKSNPNYSVTTTFIKIRHGLINVALVLMVYQFFLRSGAIFLKMFLLSSIVVIVLFMITIFTPVKILPLRMIDRGFIDIQRLIMGNYGLLPILIPMGAVLINFNLKIRYRRLILAGFVLMFCVWIISLRRRDIFGTAIYFVIAYLLNNYLTYKPLFSLKKIVNLVLILGFTLFTVQLVFPKYIDAAIVASQEAIHVIQYGETTTGRKDVRLGLGKEFMQETIRENFVFGTGFDNRWRTSDGDKQGFEASDYPFLAAVGMSGIIGLLFFLPIYVVLFKSLLFDLRAMHTPILVENKETFFVLMTFIVFFIFDFMQYMNWFLPLSLFSHSGHKSWYVFLAMYFASRRVFYEGTDFVVLRRHGARISSFSKV